LLSSFSGAAAGSSLLGLSSGRCCSGSSSVIASVASAGSETVTSFSSWTGSFTLSSKSLSLAASLASFFTCPWASLAFLISSVFLLASSLAASLASFFAGFWAFFLFFSVLFPFF